MTNVAIHSRPATLFIRFVLNSDNVHESLKTAVLPSMPAQYRVMVTPPFSTSAAGEFLQSNRRCCRSTLPASLSLSKRPVDTESHLRTILRALNGQSAHRRNPQDPPVWYSQYEQRGLPWRDLRFGKNRRPLSMRQTAHDSDGDTSEESTVAVAESQANSSA